MRLVRAAVITAAFGLAALTTAGPALAEDAEVSAPASAPAASAPAAPPATPEAPEDSATPEAPAVPATPESNDPATERPEVPGTENPAPPTRPTPGRPTPGKPAAEKPDKPAQGDAGLSIPSTVSPGDTIEVSVTCPSGATDAWVKAFGFVNVGLNLQYGSSFTHHVMEETEPGVYNVVLTCIQDEQEVASTSTDVTVLGDDPGPDPGPDPGYEAQLTVTPKTVHAGDKLNVTADCPEADIMALAAFDGFQDYPVTGEPISVAIPVPGDAKPGTYEVRLGCFNAGVEDHLVAEAAETVTVVADDEGVEGDEGDSDEGDEGDDETETTTVIPKGAPDTGFGGGQGGGLGGLAVGFSLIAAGTGAGVIGLRRQIRQIRQS